MTQRGQRIFALCFLALIFGVPLSQAVVEIAGGRVPGVASFFTHMPTQENLRASEKELESASAVARAVRP